MIDITPLENAFNSLPSTPIINRLHSLSKATSQEEKKAIYDEAIQYLNSRGQEIKEKWQKVFDRWLTY